ncbi:MAG: DUF4440 domain-containing protein [Candidatus Eremiobacteraeota bacterium]|nr:DUF4440 domain-containing protein [Candidatus Eremiobacteraeota bacterium]MCW5867775.1 DUF4440 domain-containing protein [Candidatus Eremiobacteraeota bacterium]
MPTEKLSPAVEAFRGYTRAFQDLDPRRVAHYFHEPAFTITPHGLTPLPTRNEVEEVYRRLMRDLPAQGYARTEFSPLQERGLADDLVTVSGSGAWKKSNGEVIRRFGMTYTLRRSKGVWRVAVALIHDPV